MDGEILMSNGYGVADIVTRRPVTNETLFGAALLMRQIVIKLVANSNTPPRFLFLQYHTKLYTLEKKLILQNVSPSAFIFIRKSRSYLDQHSVSLTQKEIS